MIEPGTRYTTKYNFNKKYTAIVLEDLGDNVKTIAQNYEIPTKSGAKPDINIFPKNQLIEKQVDLKKNMNMSEATRKELKKRRLI